MQIANTLPTAQTDQTRRGAPSERVPQALIRSGMQAVPQITISGVLEHTKSYDPHKIHSFRYRAKRHRELPHVVKFSGGRSSGMLLFALLENDLLKQQRGDVVGVQ